MTPSRWHILTVLFLVRTAMGYQFQSAAALSPYLRDALSIDFVALGTLIGAYMLPGIIVALPGGLLDNRFGDRRVTFAGLAMMAAIAWAPRSRWLWPGV